MLIGKPLSKSIITTAVIVLCLGVLPACFAAEGPTGATGLELEAQAKEHIKNNEFGQALDLYDKLLKLDIGRSRQTSALLHQAQCQYYLGKYDDAEKTLKAGVPFAQDKFAWKLLLAQVYYDSGRLTQAEGVLTETINADDIWCATTEASELLSRVYEQLSVDALAAGKTDEGRTMLKKALDALTKSDRAREGDLSFASPLKHRIACLEQKLKAYPEVGIACEKSPKPLSWQDILSEAGKYLSKDQLAALKYPFDTDDDMRGWVKANIPGSDSEVQKTHRLYRLMMSDSGLRLRDYYDQVLAHDRSEYWTGRTAKQVFHELYAGDPEYGYDADQKYRYGDCESATNLYIALARAAGLQAYMVRLYSDCYRNSLAEHRGAGIITQDKRLIIIDLSWYESVDCKYAAYRLMDDLQNYSYYLYGYNITSKSGLPYLSASLSIFPENELCLRASALKALADNKPVEAINLLDRIPESARDFDGYWTTLADVRVHQNNLTGAIAVLQQARERIPNSADIAAKEGKLLKQAGRKDEALKALREAVEIYPIGQSENWRLIASIENGKKNYEAALEAYESSKERADSDYDVAVADDEIARIYAETGDYSNALDSYALALVEYQESHPVGLIDRIMRIVSQRRVEERIVAISDKAVGPAQNRQFMEYYDLAHRLRPKAKALLAGMANLHLKLDDVDEAKRLFAESGSARATVRLAEYCRKHGKWNEAVKVVDDALAIQPFEADTEKDVLKLYASAGKQQAGLAKLEPFVSKEKYPSSYWSVMAESAVSAHLYDRGLTYYCRGASGSIYDDAAIKGYVLCYRKLGRKAATAILTQEIRQRPTASAGVAQLAGHFEKQKEWKEAAGLIRMTLQQPGLTDDTLMKFFDIYSEQGRLHEGVRDAMTVINSGKRQNRSNLLYQPAYYLLAANDCHYAASIAGEIIRSETNAEVLSNAYNVLGLATQRLGDLKKAQACFQKALELKPNNESAASNLAALNETLQEAGAGKN